MSKFDKGDKSLQKYTIFLGVFFSIFGGLNPQKTCFSLLRKSLEKLSSQNYRWFFSGFLRNRGNNRSYYTEPPLFLGVSGKSPELIRVMHELLLFPGVSGKLSELTGVSSKTAKSNCVLN